jgi:hypothetical protein
VTSPKWLKDSFLTILFCAVGFLAIWIAKSGVGMQQEAMFVAFLLMPLLVYVVVAGRLTEFKAFGTEAKFATVAQQSVEPVSGSVEPSIEDIEMVAKEGLTELQKRKALLDESKPILLTLVLGRYEYHFISLEKYVEALNQCPTFKGAVILKSDGSFVVYFPSRSLTSILNPVAGPAFVDKIRNKDTRGLQDYPGAIKRTVTKDSSNIDALNEMTLQNADTLIVINADKKVSGVVERQQLISKLILAMAK